MNIFSCLLLLAIANLTHTLKPTKVIFLYPNTQNSLSLYLINFTLDKALPSNSYLLLGMDWYSSAVNPYNCILVNTSIATACTNLASPTISLTISASNFAKFNSILSPTKVIAVLVRSNLLAGTTYALQLHLYNVVPNI